MVAAYTPTYYDEAVGLQLFAQKPYQTWPSQYILKL
jgi:hypothetical protein